MFWSNLGPEIGYEALGSDYFRNKHLLSLQIRRTHENNLISGVIDSKLPTVCVFAKKRAEADRTNPRFAPIVQASDSDSDDDFSKGVLFYLRDEKVVGIMLWNVFNKISTARTVIGQDKTFDDINEIVKLFDIHS